MRYISKTRRCTGFEHYIASSRPVSWSKFKASVKLALHQHLLEEQQHLCIYCQQSIPRKEKIDTPPEDLHPSHIEHIRPKNDSRFSHLAFEHTNLAVSCNGFDIERDRLLVPEFCGHPKQDVYDEALFLHPFEEPEIEQFFEYDINGKISPAARAPTRAAYTIGLLRLDEPVLSAMRERQYQLLIEETTLHGLDITDYLDPAQSELPKFYSMLKQLFGLA